MRRTADAITEKGTADLSLSLGCIIGTPVAYLTPYSLEVPLSTNIYLVGIWSTRGEEFVEGDLIFYEHPEITDDGSALVIFHRVQLNEIIRLLEQTNQNRNPDLELNILMYDSDNNNVESFGGAYDPSGLQDALQHLPCL